MISIGGQRVMLRLESVTLTETAKTLESSMARNQSVFAPRHPHTDHDRGGRRLNSFTPLLTEPRIYSCSTQ